MPARKVLQNNEPSSPLLYRGVEAMARVAENGAGASQHLLESARKLLHGRHRMDQLVPKDLQRHAVWNVLLELYVSGEEGRILHVKHAAIITGETSSAAMRTIDRLEEVRFIHRQRDAVDRRCVVISLTEAGRFTVTKMLQNIFAPEEETEREQRLIAFTPRQ